MTTRRDLLGRGCLWCSLAALYSLIGMKAYVAWREGLWLDWPLGNYLPDAAVRWVFSLPDGAFRGVLAWLLRQDVIYHAAAVALLIWLLGLIGGPSAGKGGDRFPGDDPPGRVKEV